MTNKQYTLADSEITGHIEMLQGIINRMSTNSANCKTWAITLAVGVFALSDAGGWQRFFICFGASVMFYLLDCYYLGMEKNFIGQQRYFVEEVNKEAKGKVKPFEIAESTWKDQLNGTIDGMKSMSTTPFYLILVILPLIFVCTKNSNSPSDSETETSGSTHTTIISPQNLNVEHPLPDCLIESCGSSSKTNPTNQSSPHSSQLSTASSI